MDTTMVPDEGGCLPLGHLWISPTQLIGDAEEDRQSSPPIQRCDASLAAAGLQIFGGFGLHGYMRMQPKPAQGDA